MIPEKQIQHAPSNGLLGAIALSWLPVVLFLGLSADKETEPKAFGAAVAGAMIVIVIYGTSRKHAWSVILWVPLMLFAAIGALTLLGTGVSARMSGPSAAPLEGAAVLLMLLLAAGLGLFAMTGGLFPPKTSNGALLIIAGLNTALMLIAGSIEVTVQVITLHLSDPSGRPIIDAEVRYERFGYGSGGSELFDASGGPFYSDNKGVVRIPSRRMRYKTLMMISKEGFREITVALDMQFSENDKSRNYSLSTPETPTIATGAVPASEPVLISLCLSPLSDTPSQAVIHFGLYSKRDMVDAIKPRSLDLETGKFASDLSGDIELEYFSATTTRFRDQRLRIRGLNGVQLFLVFHNECLPTMHTHYEQVYRIAPRSGYQQEIIIENPGDSPGRVVYIRGAGGKLHGRLCLEALGDGVDEIPRYSGTLEINPSGRNLEWVKKDG